MYERADEGDEPKHREYPLHAHAGLPSCASPGMMDAVQHRLLIYVKRGWN
jgi:hypothetical protein